MAKQKITREELVTRAATVFRKKGYYNTTMNDIGVICGLLKGSIYHYFQSKEELMLEVLKASYQEAGNNIFALAYNKSIPSHKRLSMMLDIPEAGLFGNGTEDGGCLFGRIGLEIGSLIPEFNEVIKTHFNSYVEAFVTIFSELVSLERAKELAKQAVVEMQGAVILSVIYSDAKIFTEAKQRILNYIS
jgi:TetR/AcrR family transcriptional repressor of lmrAB and yxaGH operons